ncbi:DNA mismatch repair endonuclease MutL [Thalassotalea psychrophila]|uniref:DNA mismatch repair protein MutL n=1 Tax=Thalassotalea psychrophila TaxID=3065647 RepID=A0ABY9TUV2_9GAMM|nr:DNA mismatch repair endonuclease MutL [Colwelliaceae bacterium SQ149]
MSIAVLPARLANQIAAGEVVERPASVVKELVENSIDAGATKISIEIEKGGSKRIKITDDGKGIVKDELTLALSRHATSKIKSLDDLESIHSLGFRGEALASISSVSRLTLTSKPVEQDSAWQAIAVGRDMQVDIKPAAHPDGTSIDVEDLFFNTPARRKFLRTEKTEFTHIDEVVRRIALSKLAITIILSHNGKVIRQYRSAKTEKQIEKRIASVCGQGFIDNAITLDFKHDNLHLWGWIAKPEFYQRQNDLSYSYVNDRMMRDKLINHAIRQAYADRLTHDGYPAFVLFFNLDFADVDVNVHPAKHEVRFHQARFVHDFICSAVEQTLNAEQSPLSETLLCDEHGEVIENASQPYARDYVQPLQMVSEKTANQANNYPNTHQHSQQRPSQQAVGNYHSLLATPHTNVVDTVPIATGESSVATTFSSPAEFAPAVTASQPSINDQFRLLTMVGDLVALVEYKQTIYCMQLKPLCIAVNRELLSQSFANGIVSQPLLLPVSITLDKAMICFIDTNLESFERAGIKCTIKGSQCIIRQYPAQLRDKDISQSFLQLLNLLMADEFLSEQTWLLALAELKLPEQLDLTHSQQLLLNGKTLPNFDLSEYMRLNSIEVDLISYINQLAH